MNDALSSARHVEALLAIPYLLMGASHVVQPGMWRADFTRLHTDGAPALVTRTFTLELWPALSPEPGRLMRPTCPRDEGQGTSQKGVKAQGRGSQEGKRPGDSPPHRLGLGSLFLVP
ncbi:hypothetical protein LuPra_01867 [Luteitalea pratensis]|uniref:Uncharacterized protein n=1 Tax=Luteitalea pratensis TaxID=1855912 RepID=A0A143PK83_LUTPR|nr:hypothetical protein [Luteitalea pratensis]AMY08663.1 hypothetical protein LuPra_01867 [Luteitalea pratensis]